MKILHFCESFFKSFSDLTSCKTNNWGVNVRVFFAITSSVLTLGGIPAILGSVWILGTLSSRFYNQLFHNETVDKTKNLFEKVLSKEIDLPLFDPHIPLSTEKKKFLLQEAEKYRNFLKQGQNPSVAEEVYEGIKATICSHKEFLQWPQNCVNIWRTYSHFPSESLAANLLFDFFNRYFPCRDLSSMHVDFCKGRANQMLVPSPDETDPLYKEYPSSEKYKEAYLKEINGILDDEEFRKDSQSFFIKLGNRWDSLLPATRHFFERKFIVYIPQNLH